MHNTRTKLNGRSTRTVGALWKILGKMSRNPGWEFHGDQLIITGKLEEYYAGCRLASGGRRQSRTGTFVERRRSFHVVA